MSQFVSLNTIIGNGKSYQVPIYQRDYSWEKDDWENLWNDIEDIPNDKTHYLGYLVMQPIDSEEDSFWIIDGQQRLTTLSIITLAIIALLDKWNKENIEPEDNKIRKEKIIERYLGNYSLSKLVLVPKLKLNRNNDDFFKSWLLQLRFPSSISKLKPSQRLLLKAFDYYFLQIQEKFKNNNSGADLADFLEKIIGNGIVFTQIIVDNDLDAFKVFETLNARGVKLSTSDLLKNYLFKLTFQLSQLDLEEAERRWQNIVNILQSRDLTTFIRHFWNSKYKLERQQSLFKAIKREINSPQKAFDFLNELELVCGFYSSFYNPYDDLWDKEEKNSLKLISLLNTDICFSVMLIAIINFPRVEFKILIRELSILLFRYHLSNLNPNEAERLFNKISNQIYGKNIVNAKDAISEMKSIYVKDDNFEQNFSTLSINTRTKKELVKYILISIENQIANKKYQAEEAVATIEHIIPENPGCFWDEYFPIEIHEDYIYRLGNYSLLEGSINNKLDNTISFEQKLLMYKSSCYKLSSEYVNYERFTPKELSLRQDRMAKIAKGIWKSSIIKSMP